MTTRRLVPSPIEKLSDDRQCAEDAARNYPANHRKRSLREIAAALEAAGHVTRKGTRCAPAAIARMVGA